MEHWNKIQSNFGPLSQRASKAFANLNQSARERFGAVDADDITELPEEYRDLERRVDALKTAHTGLLRIARAYENENYDYPTQIQESITQLSASVGHSLTSWAASATKGTNLPTVKPTAAPEESHKTLAHALSRASATGALELGASPTQLTGVPMSPPSSGKERSTLGPSEDRLGEALQKFALAQDTVGNARLTQDDAINDAFLAPWTAFGQGIQVAIKARQNVRDARLYLDSCKQALKSIEASAKPDKLEKARMDVEQAEDRLVEETEGAIRAMKSCLENPEPLKALHEFVKAQTAYHTAAAEVLASVQNDLADAAVAAEGEYRKTRD